ncbi:hypothetical protein K2O51_26530 [Cupriavidus pinatubonensis]|uniref:DODA-type extradiol aromatic ring-opening family dioxygenase n=1 Tax=Cupriavidus pinatubonensis TaxID=248026 RepID=UPI001C73D22C|nr:hypothetical protein [Cupriavidus pinatubonensis]QYY30867.1 hypothetical protein K2O51_26530 [Cupriavidus pinatubonensis]
MIIAATVHFPYMTASPESACEDHVHATMSGFDRLGRAFADADVDTIIAITSEHIVNLQPRLAPAFTIGVGQRHRAFPEPHFNLSPIERRGDPDFAQAILRDLYAEGFELAHSSDLRLDHGTTLPLELMEIPDEVAIIPIIVNSIFHPLPTLTRCRDLGVAIANAIARVQPSRRVGILATGGISHTVGAPGVNGNDQSFDADFMNAMLRGDVDHACCYSDALLNEVGNGTHEIRNWIVAAGAAHRRKPEVVTEIPFAAGWNSGVFQLLWSE